MVHAINIDNTTGLAKKNNDFPIDLYYPCYSPRILTYLLSKGFEPLTTFVNIKTLKTCHIFTKNDEVNACIAEVSNVGQKRLK